MKGLSWLRLNIVIGVCGNCCTGSGSLCRRGKKVATVNIPPAPALYATEPQPLTVTQCGQCHPGVFANLKNDGGKHQFDCQKCHTTFHAYNPKKGGWDALMPKCASCHADPHGKAITDCASCHTNPHTPRKVAMAALVNACATCHAAPKEQLVKFPSKHTKLSLPDVPHLPRLQTVLLYLPQAAS